MCRGPIDFKDILIKSRIYSIDTFWKHNHSWSEQEILMIMCLFTYLFFIKFKLRFSIYMAILLDIFETLFDLIFYDKQQIVQDKCSHTNYWLYRYMWHIRQEDVNLLYCVYHFPLTWKHKSNGFTLYKRLLFKNMRLWHFTLKEERLKYCYAIVLI